MLRRFSLLLIVRIVLLLATITTLAFIFGDKRLFFNHIILASVIVVQVIELFRFINYTNRELARLFLAIKHSDFSVTFRQGYLGKSFRELQHSLTEIIKSYKDVKIEKEIQYQFLQMLVSQLQVGVISIAEGEIVLINTSAEKLLQAEGAKSWRVLSQLNPPFARELKPLGDNGRKIIDLTTRGETRMLSVDVRTLSIMDKAHKLITIQDINSEIEQKEIEAWQKLIRILTHEIMNSITPISSMTETMLSMLETKEGRQKEVSEISEETIKDIRFSLQTIFKRSNNLLNFVDSYRQFTRVPKPALENITIAGLFNDVEQLMRRELMQHNVNFTTHIAAGVDSTTLDQTLMEQVIINLVTNSLHAVEGRPDPKIDLLAYHDRGNLVLEVRDNGKGIPEKELQDIFIPFFSTKKNGSGIGLSLSKQIVSLHGGHITVRSVVGTGTSFYLNFRGK